MKEISHIPSAMLDPWLFPPYRERTYQEYFGRGEEQLVRLRPTIHLYGLHVCSHGM